MGSTPSLPVNLLFKLIIMIKHCSSIGSILIISSLGFLSIIGIVSLNNKKEALTFIRAEPYILLAKEDNIKHRGNSRR